ncbi:MAG: ABC transporter ATP-binding protein [Flavobacteriaceae bacterium]|nr:ABC transporter ATP-binding protein [Flavobacteriaceae bacterium]
MEILKKIVKFAIPYKKYAYLNIFFNVFYALFSTLSMLSLMPMMKVLFDDSEKVLDKPVFVSMVEITSYLEDYMNYFITKNNDSNGASNTLLYVVFAIITIFLFKNIFGYLAKYYITFLRNGVIKSLRETLYSKILDLPISYYSEKKKGETINKVIADVMEIQSSFLSILELIVREPLTIIFTIVSMLLISVKLTIFVFLFIPVSGFVISAIGKRLKKDSHKAQEQQGNILSILEESIGGLKIIKGYNSENHFKSNFSKLTNSFMKTSNSILNRQNLASPMSEFMGIMVITVLLWYGGNLVFVEHSIEASTFMAYMGLAYTVLTPAKAISKASYSVKRGTASAERVLEILDTENPLKDKEDALDSISFEKEIIFKDVWFKYEEQYVLKDFNLTIPKGKMVALVGQSGSGKSTIANLITRFYDVDKGEITIDGVNIKDITKRELRAKMAMVTQDSILFNDSILSNITVGSEHTHESISKALDIANASEFVNKLPKGITTNVGDSGNKLSGGQKQRISIARAVFKNPSILVLDEATSALDTESEKLVQDALENIMNNRTSIVIAHRLSTIQQADLIVVMKNGKIEEKGSHSELLKAKGNYYKLVNLQSL